MMLQIIDPFQYYHFFLIFLKKPFMNVSIIFFLKVMSSSLLSMDSNLDTYLHALDEYVGQNFQCNWK